MAIWLLGQNKNYFSKNKMIEASRPIDEQEYVTSHERDTEEEGHALDHTHCSQKVIVDNRTSQDLNLTIKYETEKHEEDSTQTPRRMTVPKGATMSQMLYCTQSDVHGSLVERGEESTGNINRQRYGHLHQSQFPVRPSKPKVERKFQPLTHHPENYSNIVSRPIPTAVTNTPNTYHYPIHTPFYRNSGQIVTVHPPIRQVRYIPSPPHATFVRTPSTEIRTVSPARSGGGVSDCSSVKEEKSSRGVQDGSYVGVQPHSSFPIGSTTVRFSYNGPPVHYPAIPPPENKVIRVLNTAASPPRSLRHYSPVHTKEFTHTVLPSTSDKSRGRISSSRLSYQPQVYNYINELYHKTLPVQDSSLYTFSDIKQRSLKHQTQTDLRVEPLDPLHYYTKPVSPNAVPSPRVDSTGLKKKLQESRDRRRMERMSTEPVNRHSVEKEYYHALPDKTFYKISHQQSTQECKKRDDLFDERKHSYLRQLENRLKNTNRLRKDLQSYKKAHHSKHCTICHPPGSSPQKIHSNRKRPMSPKAQEVTQRLFNRSKKKDLPCSHYVKLNERSERQRFEEMLRENSFVSRHISRAEAEALFQKFRFDNESVSHWPMKIVNYTYDKLRKGEEIYRSQH